MSDGFEICVFLGGDFTQRRMVVSCRCFGRNYLSHL